MQRINPAAVPRGIRTDLNINTLFFYLHSAPVAKRDMAELVCGFSSLLFVVLQALLPLLQVGLEGRGKEQSCYHAGFIHCVKY